MCSFAQAPEEFRTTAMSKKLPLFLEMSAIIVEDHAVPVRHAAIATGLWLRCWGRLIRLDRRAPSPFEPGATPFFHPAHPSRLSRSEVHPPPAPDLL